MRLLLRIVIWMAGLGALTALGAFFWLPVEHGLFPAECLAGARADQIVVHRSKIFYVFAEPDVRSSSPDAQRVVLYVLDVGRSPCQSWWLAAQSDDDAAIRVLARDVRLTTGRTPLAYVLEGQLQVGWESASGEWYSPDGNTFKPPSVLEWWRGRRYPLGSDRNGVNVALQLVSATQRSLRALPWCLVPLVFGGLIAILLSRIHGPVWRIIANTPLDLLITLPPLAALLFVVHNLDDSRNFLGALSLVAGFLFAPRSAVRLEGQLRRFRKSGRYIADRALGERLPTSYYFFMKGEGGRSLAVEVAALLAIVLLTQANLSFLKIEEGYLPSQLSLGQLARMGWSAQITGGFEARLYLWAPSAIVAGIVLSLEMLRRRLAEGMRG